MSVLELREKYPKQAEWFMMMGEKRAAKKAREEQQKQVARPKLWPIIPSGPQDRW
jgi:hypothetical protein